ncbi:MAG: TetR/AcrR family transcriptional regulator [Verrucomicrobiales bacterium]|nr:TetR/AcrR family transcriptional regulator [Verrucomicrobiales bacterium]
MTLHRSDLKERLLDAAEEVALSCGISRLTFDAIALEAGISKGGVLHHFWSKDQLIGAMVERSARRWREFYMRAYHQTSEGPGRMARALLHSGFMEPDSWAEEMRRGFSSVLVALMHNQSLVRPVRETYEELYRFLREDGLPEGVSEMIGAAFDGMWLHWALHISDLDYAMLKRVHRALGKVLKDHCAMPKPGKPAPKAPEGTRTTA